MTGRWSLRLAGLLLAVDITAVACALALAAGGPEFLASVVVGIWLLVVSLVGGIVGIRRPDHPLGWLLLATGFFIALASLSREYALLALAGSGGSLPVGDEAGWLSSWLPLPGFVAYGLVLILFPSGRPRSRLWRAAVVAAVGLGAIATVSVAFMPGAIDGLRVETGRAIPNPFGVEEAGRRLQQSFQVSSAGLILFAISGVVVRLVSFRRATGQERQQLKWFIFAIGMLLVTFAINILTTSSMDEEDVTYHVLAFFVPMVAVLAIPLAIGVAILRYRLYDIDRIVNRTLVYGILSAVLAAVYALCVVVVPRALRLGGDSELVVAVSTLAVAALFQPLRRRIQRLIDRRFYRRRYDAVRTVEQFSSRLRNEVDLEAMRVDLVTAVHETVQPHRVSLWLRA